MLAITDRDLLVIDPSVFIGLAAAAATTLLAATDGAIAGTQLQSTSSDFEDGDIGFGHVAVIDDAVAIEVVSRTNSTTVEVSQPRSSSLDAKIPPGDAAEASVRIVTFARMIELARVWTLGSLGIEDEAVITDPAAVSHLIALRAIAKALGHAAAMNPDEASLTQRASLASAEAARAARRTSVAVDLDGDGRPDATRYAAAVVFPRA